MPPAPTSKPRYGTGWWFRTAAFVVILLVIAGAVSNASKPTPGDPTGTSAPVGAGSRPTVAPVGAASRAPVSVSGSGIAKSKPFALAGDYTVNWTATPDSKVGCYHGAHLERADGDFMFEMLANEMLDSATPESGTSQLYNLDAASYYVAASSGCGWNFTFTPA